MAGLQSRVFLLGYPYLFVRATHRKIPKPKLFDQVLHPESAKGESWVFSSCSAVPSGRHLGFHRILRKKIAPSFRTESRSNRSATQTIPLPPLLPTKPMRPQLPLPQNRPRRRILRADHFLDLQFHRHSRHKSHRARAKFIGRGSAPPRAHVRVPQLRRISRRKPIHISPRPPRRLRPSSARPRPSAHPAPASANTRSTLSQFSVIIQLLVLQELVHQLPSAHPVVIRQCRPRQSVLLPALPPTAPQSMPRSSGAQTHPATKTHFLIRSSLSTLRNRLPQHPRRNQVLTNSRYVTIRGPSPPPHSLLLSSRAPASDLLFSSLATRHSSLATLPSGAAQCQYTALG